MFSMASLHSRFALRRCYSITSARLIKRIKEVTEGDLTTIELENVPDEPSQRYFQQRLAAAKEIRQQMAENAEEQLKPQCSCAFCQIPVKVCYKDVLILEQFMRLDGTVLPAELTGLCRQQQQRLERCVMQAHWSGLFPDRTIPEFDRTGYKQFNRHWEDDLDMFRLKLKMQPGSFFYIKRYNPRAENFQKETTIFHKKYLEQKKLREEKKKKTATPTK